MNLLVRQNSFLRSKKFHISISPFSQSVSFERGLLQVPNNGPLPVSSWGRPRAQNAQFYHSAAENVHSDTIERRSHGQLHERCGPFGFQIKMPDRFDISCLTCFTRPSP